MKIKRMYRFKLKIVTIVLLSVIAFLTLSLFTSSMITKVNKQTIKKAVPPSRLVCIDKQDKVIEQLTRIADALKSLDNKLQAFQIDKPFEGQRGAQSKNSMKKATKKKTK